MEKNIIVVFYICGAAYAIYGLFNMDSWVNKCWKWKLYEYIPRPAFKFMCYLSAIGFIVAAIFVLTDAIGII